MNYDYDVIIVGGGPSGVITAISIAQEGYSKIVIIDKKPRNLIGDKNCGDALDTLYADILEDKMGITPPSLEKGEARELTNWISIAANSLQTKLTASASGYLVNRLVYGQRLLNTAEKLGVEIKAHCYVRGIIVENDHVVGIKYFDEKRKLQELRAKITVDASGYIGIIRKLIPDKLKNGIDYTIPDKFTIGTYREIIRLKNSDDHQFREEIILLYHKDIPPPGYLWIFSEGPQMLNIGITWVKSIPYPESKSMKKLFHSYLDPLIDPSTYDVIEKGGGNIPMRPNFDSLVFNGALLVGDAAALVDPTTFEGHGPALDSGRVAGKTIAQAIKKENFTFKTLWSYNTNIMKYPGGMHTQSYLASLLLKDIGSNGINFLLRKNILSEEELKVIFQDNNAKMPLKSKLWKFIKAFPRWDIMIIIKKYIDLIEKTISIYDEYPEDPALLNQWRLKRNRMLKIDF